MDVLLADDQYDVRRALRFLLENAADLNVVSEASNDAELLAQLGVACPDFVLLDWELPGNEERDILERIRALRPTLNVIVLSARPEARDEALRRGAQGFVSKSDPPDCLLAMLREMSN